ncbi:hypothetical protein K443DRAFT_11563 [Laccaria amethystina LaAM-08-1]|uniref:Unplaced genomic scaffold K443scaffold_230, whole genome shotgun sequence n=1 Tax=Laccaria amethystina LaAM-08-1 TaxID=1095629 RepID=A0A0C9XBM8_9AGAR|nr:hypothetical protein K443DRAFT_11563 [Laccaria amethystina LaAM-08-1]
MAWNHVDNNVDCWNERHTDCGTPQSDGRTSDRDSSMMRLWTALTRARITRQLSPLITRTGKVSTRPNILRRSPLTNALAQDG